MHSCMGALAGRAGATRTAAAAGGGGTDRCRLPGAVQGMQVAGSLEELKLGRLVRVLPLTCA